jgi:predicted membrane protein
MGAGTGELKLGGLTLTSLEIAMGAGEMEVDLTGDWQHDLEALIQGGVGEVNIRLPSNVGVWVEARDGIGEINAQGLKREGGAYVNDAYGQSDVTLRLRVNGGIGEINLISAG